MNVCTYARVDRKDRLALKSQTQRLSEYAADRGYNVTAAIEDCGISGLANTSSLDAIIKLADSDLFDAVLVFSPARVSRDTLTCLEFWEALKMRGKELLFVSEGVGGIEACFLAVKRLYRGVATCSSGITPSERD